MSEDINFNLKISEKIMIKYFGDLENPMAKILLSNVNQDIMFLLRYQQYIILRGIMEKNNQAYLFIISLLLYFYFRIYANEIFKLRFKYYYI